MKKLLFILGILTLSLTANAQVASSLGIGPVGPLSTCKGDPLGLVLCAVDDGFGYISVKNSPFLKLGQGPKGDPGTPGTSATVAVGTTTTLAAGAPATVTNTGTPSAAVFNFAIPQGVKGDKGADGLPGAPGTNWKSCPFTITSFAQDGKGGASGTIVIDPTKCL